MRSGFSAFSRRFRRACSVLVVLAVMIGLANARPAAAQAPGPVLPIQAQVRNKILEERIGAVSLKALNPPPEFIDRVADRIVRMQYQIQNRRVFDDSAGPAVALVPSEPGDTRSITGWLFVGAVAIALVVTAWFKQKRVKKT